MIEWLMFGALGFLLGRPLALMLAPPLWNRAVKLTTRKLEATMPMSLNDIQADKDQLRAEFAIELRKVEVALDKAKEKATRELIEANKRRVEIAMVNTDLASAKSQLQENESANRVLQQTIKRRLPDLDSRLKAARRRWPSLSRSMPSFAPRWRPSPRRSRPRAPPCTISAPTSTACAPPWRAAAAAACADWASPTPARLPRASA